MSAQYPFPPQDVSTGNDMEDWFSMLSCIVNFLSAAANLAIKLEQNYLINNVTNVRKPALPLLPAPPLLEENIPELPIASTPLEDERMLKPPVLFRKNTLEVPRALIQCEDKLIIDPQELNKNEQELTADESSVENVAEEYLLEQVSISPTYPESECSDLPQETMYLNTQNMGDFSSTNLALECAGYDSNVEQVINYADQPDETIKICSSEDICYFDDFTDSSQTVESSIRNVTSDDICGSSKDGEEEYSTPLGSFEDKSVQAKRKNDAALKESKMKPSKSQEIQTQSTNRFKGRVMELITKSPELQQPIKEAIIAKTKTVKENPINKQSTVPKNLNELKEQLESIKKLPLSKQVSKEEKDGKKKEDPQEKRSVLKSSRIPVDKNSFKRGINKIEKPTANVPNATSLSNHIPLKSPGTSKRFASVESVVKKLIRSSKVVEKQTGENKDKTKEENNVKKPTVPMEKIAEDKKSIVEPKLDLSEKKECPQKECIQKEIKTVKNHNDFIYKKYAPPKSASTASRPATKRTTSRKSSEVSTTKSRSPSRGPRTAKNTSATIETTRKKEMELKRALLPTNQKLKNQKMEETCDKQ